VLPDEERAHILPKTANQRGTRDEVHVRIQWFWVVTNPYAFFPLSPWTSRVSGIATVLHVPMTVS